MNRFALNLKFLVPSIVLLILISGCVGKPLDGFTGERGQVSGKITLGGEPVQTGCQVTFMSVKGSYLASGVITEGGRYSLSYRVKEGLPAVDYLIQLAPPVGPASTTAVDPAKMGAAAKISPGQLSGSEDGKPFPSMYVSSTTSKLQFKVKAGQNTADFGLVPMQK